MSYDIDLKSVPCPHCNRPGDEPEHLNPTYNLTPIFDLALTLEPLPNPDVGEIAVVLLGADTDRPRGLRLLSGKTGEESIEPLRQALARLNDPAMRDRFVSLEPPNKWGTLKDAVWVVSEMIRQAVDYPENVWKIR